MNPNKLIQLPYTLEDVDKELAARAGQKMRMLFPDTGRYRRELYTKHLAFMRAGSTHRERCFLAGNRVGKTQCAAYEVTCHLTGLYPDWWEGKRFEQPIRAWAAGDTAKTVREIIVVELLGLPGQYGSGMLPARNIKHVAHAAQGTVDRIWVHHVSGGVSLLTLKSYDQRRESFQGSALDLVWLDEEPPQDIYTECLMRTMTTEGILLMTMTPLMGATSLVLSFLTNQETALPSERTDG